MRFLCAVNPALNGRAKVRLWENTTFLSQVKAEILSISCSSEGVSVCLKAGREKKNHSQCGSTRFHLLTLVHLFTFYKHVTRKGSGRDADVRRTGRGCSDSEKPGGQTSADMTHTHKHTLKPLMVVKSLHGVTGRLQAGVVVTGLSNIPELPITDASPLPHRQYFSPSGPEPLHSVFPPQKGSHFFLSLQNFCPASFLTVLLLAAQRPV